MHRAYWAIPRTLKTKAGEQTNVSFGMASMLLAILAHEEPDSLLVCFDAGDKTFRHQENETYKEGRSETPDEFYDQIPRVMELMEAFHFAVVSDSEYEADDFLGTYAKAGEEEDMRVTVVTGDKDAFQLATDKTRVAIPHKGYQQAEYLGPDEIFYKYGIRPDQVASYKGLTGDSSDNLPGVHGIGPKTASSLLQKYDNLKGIYENLPDIKGSVREKLENDKDQAFFCERMAELVLDIKLPISMNKIELKDIDPCNTFEMFKELEFTLLVKRYQKLLEGEYGKKHFVKCDSVESSSSKEIDKKQLTLF